MAKQKSRTARWEEAASSAEAALNEAKEKLDGLFTPVVDALQQLAEVQEEYQEWHDNMPEGLQQSPVGEKLEAIADIDLSFAGMDAMEAIESLSEIEEVIDQAQSAELPLGFGRD